MKRTIKFRAWDNVDYMSNPFTLQDIQEGKIQFTSDCKVMQFTGLLDKNGKEIYEGDLISYDTNDLCIVEYVDCGFMRHVVRWDLRHQYYPFRSHHKYIVIGNLFENPELLNKP
jgi:YopX protein